MFRALTRTALAVILLAVGLILIGRFILPISSTNRLLYRSTRGGSSSVITSDVQHFIRRDLTRSTTWNGRATASPDGRRIAFESYRLGNLDIYTMLSDGSRLQPITTDPARDAYPAWSPDGRRIAFASDRGGNWDVFVMDSDGGAAMRLTTSPLEDSTPVWSPDGAQIAYVTYFRNNWDIFLMNADGTDSREAMPYINARTLDPAWSPDGRWLVFASDRVEKQFDIYRYEFTTGEIVRLTHETAMDMNPTFSPDGRAIWFESWRSGAPEIYAMALDGSAVQRLTHDTLQQSGVRVGDPG